MTAKSKTIALRIGSLGIAAGVAWLAWHHSSSEAERTHQFGPVPLNARLKHDLVIKNPTAAAISLRAAKPGCTCLQIQEPIPSLISANSHVTLQVTFVPEKLGHVQTSLELDAPGLIQDEWLYRAEVIPPPEALPAPEVVQAAQDRLKQRLVLPAAEAVTMAEDQRLIIDVRSAIDFQASTIVGAMNIPLSQLATLPSSFRKQRVLVLDRGYGAESTAETVTTLRSAGWKDLYIVEGGLSAWTAHGGRITSAETPDAWLISSDEARLNATKPGWIIIAPEAIARSFKLEQLFPEVLTFSDTTPEAAAHLATAINSRRPGSGSCTSTLHLLIATETGENATPFARSIRTHLAGNPLFVMEGGLRDYIDHIRNLKPDQPRQWITMAHFAGALADLRTRQRIVTSCTSCPR